MQSVWSRIWIRVTVFISCDNNHYTMRTSYIAILETNIMAEGFRFTPLGLVRLRTFRLSTWVSYVKTWVQVLTRVRGGCVVHRCQNKNPIERLTSGCEWRLAPEAHARRVLGILKKSVSWVESCCPKKKGDFRLLAEALGWCRTRWGQMVKPE